LSHLKNGKANHLVISIHYSSPQFEKVGGFCSQAPPVLVYAASA
jgi:hypothetical protein